MGMFDELKEQAEDLAEKAKPMAEGLIEKAKDAGLVDKAKDAVEGLLHHGDGQSDQNSQ